ncbi:peptidoglycan-binding domain-containing protein [Saliterribacillus persicus]|uniref:Peptidoglycan binding protein n=1 Tax=Saliterribacillus persicus TaxID=930114 RepID=A0A368XUA9_9BACI|nr:hypothetical protein [Saliterribacillus persicus]RCW70618.1 hypothetical protein DFR57_10615 [Saliterribacillus persicus]
MVIKALQKRVGAKQDGLVGPKTIRKIQLYLLTYQDGKISEPSEMVKPMQHILSEGKF